MSGDSWVLFGLDLRPYLASLRLAIYQIAWGEESGLFKRMSPDAQLRNADAVEPVLIDVFGGELSAVSSSAATAPEQALLLGNDEVLNREIILPVAFEAQWNQAVELEVQNASPFPPERTRFGSKILMRQNEQLTIAIVITSIEAMERLIAANPEASKEAEIWCDCGECLVRINDGDALSPRQIRYLTRLQSLVVKCSAVLVAASVCLLLPAWAANIRSDQYATQLEEAKETSRSASALRAELDDYSEKLRISSERYSERVRHSLWLHALSAVTPDGAYLSRLEFKGRGAEVSGYADNAAELQSRLVASELFTDVTATAAFRRNARMGLEQFSFELTLGELPSGQGVSEK